MKKLAVAIMIASIVLVSGCVRTQSPYEREFAGNTIHFRANLDDAANVSVLPNDAYLIEALLSPSVQRIGVAFVPNETENGFYAADSFELAYKLVVAQKAYYNRTILVDSIPVNSTSEAFKMSSAEYPVIMLLGPSQTNVTGVFVQGSFITVEGASLDETDRDYTDLDLATDKLLMVIMGL